MDWQGRAKELFEFFDANGDGVISRGEFVSVAETLMGEKGQGVSAPHFNAADRNSDGKIPYSEFLAMLEDMRAL